MVRRRLSLSLPFSLSLSLSVANVLLAAACVAAIAVPEEGLPPQRGASMIAFVTTSGGHAEIAVADGEGVSPPRVITSLRSHVTHPRLSNSREHIVFSSDYGRGHPILFVVGSDGTHLRPLSVEDDPAIQVAADWAPDDSMLVTEEIDPVTGFTRLFIVDAEVWNDSLSLLLSISLCSSLILSIFLFSLFSLSLFSLKLCFGE
jgi:hypothetical protein